MITDSTNIQESINKSTSLKEITDIINLLQPNEEIKNIKVNKIFSNGINYINISLSKNLCSSRNIKEVSMEEMMNVMTKEPKINCEHPSFISLSINEEMKDFNENDKIRLSQKYGKIIEFLHSMFPRAKKLCLSIGEENKFNNNFLIYIVDKLNCNMIEEMGIFDVNDILNYGRMYKYNDNDIFNYLPNLKKFSICIYNYFEKYDGFDEEIEFFLNYLSLKKTITLEVYCEDNKKSLDITLQILNYSETINLNVNTFLCTEWNDNIISKEYKFVNNVQKIIQHLTTVTISIIKFEDFKLLNLILTTASNIKSISIYLEKALLHETWKKFLNNYKKATEYLKEYLNFNCTSTNLEKIKLYHYRFRNSTCSESRMCNYNLFYDTFMESFIKIFPRTINMICFNYVERLSITFFNTLSSHFNALKSISFLCTFNVPTNALSNVQSLKNIIIHGEMILDIPSWIDIVMFCYYDIDYYYGYENNSDMVTNEHYFKLMSRSYNNSLRHVYNNEIYYIAFLNDIKKYEDVFILSEECI
uniref:F-box domain-containing protein n=1 Tax=Parastrongyloides trichosuri TaxID=131310 RepID=A0A0N5A6N5_PARTI